jgi:hypothetical protein
MHYNPPNNDQHFIDNWKEPVEERFPHITLERLDGMLGSADFDGLIGKQSNP